MLHADLEANEQLACSLRKLVGCAVVTGLQAKQYEAARQIWNMDSSGQRERDGEAGSENATPVNRGGGEDDGGGSGRTTTSDGCTSTGETIFVRLTDSSGW